MVRSPEADTIYLSSKSTTLTAARCPTRTRRRLMSVGEAMSQTAMERSLEQVTIRPLAKRRWRTASLWWISVFSTSPVFTSQTLQKRRVMEAKAMEDNKGVEQNIKSENKRKATGKEVKEKEWAQNENRVQMKSIVRSEGKIEEKKWNLSLFNSLWSEFEALTVEDSLEKTLEKLTRKPTNKFPSNCCCEVTFSLDSAQQIWPMCEVISELTLSFCVQQPS